MLGVLLLNEYDVSMSEGLLVDLDVCKLLKVSCHGVPVGVVDDGRIIEDLSTSVANYLTTIDLSKFNVLKFTLITGNVLKVLVRMLGIFRFKTMVIRSKSLHEDDISIVRTLANGLDLLVVNAAQVHYLLAGLGLSDKHVDGNELLKLLGSKNLLIVNYGDRPPYLNMLFTKDEEIQVSSAIRCSTDLLATYLTIKTCFGDSLRDLLKESVKTCEESMKYGLRVDSASMPNVFYDAELNNERYRVITRLREAIRLLEESSEFVARLVPEVQMNIAYALPKQYLRGLDDVAAIPGRIVRVGDRVKAVESPDFGASKHLARALMKIMEYDSSKRSVANIRFDEEILKIARGLGYTISFYDRSQEPPEVKAVEGATIPWGVEQAIKRVGYVPDIIYHTGDFGKEAVITIVGNDPVDVVKKILRIAENLLSRRP